ncbi:MAG: hypothetical protein PHT31_05955 [Candidatus Omnitrophica bacterium]|nr:hypothetical protein [Candidatus Omnitrophota bacterium]MDD5653682.1 hypothetical protein [Candidatus Omnitrophota bacterium]
MPENKVKSFVFFSQTGCFLPFLIIFNLFFGWLFLRPLYWLGLEGVLILLFLLNAAIFSRKLSSLTKDKRRKGAIDIEGEVVEEKEKKREKLK